MKIYFAGAIRGGREDKALYLQLIQYLSQYGEILTEHIGDVNLTEAGEIEPSDTWIYQRDMDWLKAADVLVAEVTTPSLGVGYEIASAENLQKKILCLYRIQPNKRLSAMISGSEKVNVVKYETLAEAFTQIDNFFGKDSI